MISLDAVLLVMLENHKQDLVQKMHETADPAVLLQLRGAVIGLTKAIALVDDAEEVAALANSRLTCVA